MAASPVPAVWPGVATGSTSTSSTAAPITASLPRSRGSSSAGAPAGAEEASRPLAGLVRRGIRFTQAEVTAIDIDRCSVSTISGEVPYDQLVLASALVEGLAETAYGFYTLLDAERLRDALARFGGGRILIAVAATPYRSLAAPYEAAFPIDDFLRKRGVPAKLDIVTAEPRPISLADRAIGERVVHQACMTIIGPFDWRMR